MEHIISRDGYRKPEFDVKRALPKWKCTCGIHWVSGSRSLEEEMKQVIRFPPHREFKEGRKAGR